MTEADREHEWNRDKLLIETAKAIEKLMHLTRDTVPAEKLLPLGIAGQEGRLGAARERFEATFGRRSP